MEYTRRLELRIDRETQERLDRLRGDLSRSEWIRDRINELAVRCERLAEQING